MKKIIIILLFFTSLFACDTSSNVKAYNNYTYAKQKYIQAIIDNNTPKKIEALKEIVSCGTFLGFDTKKYKIRLYQLLRKKIKSSNPLTIESNYIRLISYNPITIRHSSNTKIRFFTLKKGHTYYKVFDLFNAKTSKSWIKKLNSHLFFRIAQNNRKKVRIVLYENRKFYIHYKNNSKYLKIFLLNQKAEIPQSIIPKHKRIIPIIARKTKKIIVIDPGHGGKDPGGIGYHHIEEKNIVLPLAKYLKKDLEREGYKVYLTRDRNIFITLRNRTKFANDKHADLFISIHCNIASHDKKIHGVTTYYLSPARSERAKRVARFENSAIGNLNSTPQDIVLNFLNRNKIVASDKLGIDIQKNLIYHLRLHYSHIVDRGVRPAPFWVLVGTHMPAILIETGYISNKMEALRLINKLYQQRYAQYIADGINSYFRKNP